MAKQQGRHIDARKLRALRYFLTREQVLLDAARKRERKGNRERKRLNWPEHVKNLLPAEFSRLYRMPLHAFNELLEVLRPHLAVNEVKAFNASKSGPIIPELQLSMALRFFILFYLFGARGLNSNVNEPICLHHTPATLPFQAFYHEIHHNVTHWCLLVF
jgi:hypothetical protein